MYSRITQELDLFLKPLSISTSCTDIFEETLLKLASVQTQPTRCQFSNSKSRWSYDDHSNRMYFRIRGITNQDAETFLNFFKETHGDDSATVQYTPPAKPGYCYIPEAAEDFDTHLFDVNPEIVFKKILPLFKEEIKRLQKESSETLVGYREKSKRIFEPLIPTPAFIPEPAPIQREQPSMLGGIYNFFFSSQSESDDEYSDESENERENSKTFSR